VAQLGVCGDNCDICPRYLATVADDHGALRQLAVLWTRLGWREASVTADDMKCRGCRTATTCAYPEQRACALDLGLSSCGECDRYPCPLVERSVRRTLDALDHCRDVCSPAQFASLARAYARKRENLSQVHDQREPQR
jgi:Protein of unknown function (DUF3795)